MKIALVDDEQNYRCVLVFLTSSPDFMPDAFSCHAFEYITKPFSPQRIFKVLGDILEMLPPLQKYIEVINGRKTIPVFLDEISSVITDAHYLDIALLSGKTLHCRMTIPEFVMLTDRDSHFLAINKGIMVNADCILEFYLYLKTTSTLFPNIEKKEKKRTLKV